MTSGSITDIGLGLVNVSSGKSNTVATVKDNSDSFAKTMQSISGSQTNQNQQSTMNINQSTKTNTRDKTSQTASDKTVNDQTDTDSKDTVTDDRNTVSDTKETDQTSETTKQEDVTDQQTDAVEDEVKDAIVDAAEEMIKNVADELDVSEDDVKAAMETLGLQMVDILNPEQLNQIVVEISGEDMMNLVTDENLYNDLQNLTGELQETLQNLSEDLGISEEDLQNLLGEIKDKLTTTETPVTVLEPVAPEEMSTQEDVPFLTREESSNIIDFRKNLTEETEESKPVQQTETQEVVPKEKITTSETQNSGEKEHTSEESTQEQSSNNMNSFQSKFDNTVITEEAIEEPKLQTPDTESILKQLSDYMKTKVSEDLTEMEMQLHPASLGTVNLQIASKAGAITAQFSVQNEEVKQAMESQIVQLKQNLEEQGVKIEAVEVTVASHSFEKNSNEQNQNQNDEYEENQTKVRPAKRRILNLNDYTDLDEISVVEDDATRIAMEMMAGNGNTLDMLA